MSSDGNELRMWVQSGQSVLRCAKFVPTWILGRVVVPLCASFGALGPFAVDWVGANRVVEIFGWKTKSVCWLRVVIFGEFTTFKRGKRINVFILSFVNLWTVRVCYLFEVLVASCVDVVRSTTKITIDLLLLTTLSWLAVATGIRYRSFLFVGVRSSWLLVSCG